ncbi:hypothetical protein [Xylella taiwanensis]|nr:hypothetical protein [Xylella taiwanensis]MCD8462525.1 hypothetical protein [Xylella taiwanensis]
MILSESPLIMLDIILEATLELNKKCEKYFHLDMSYFFVKKLGDSEPLEESNYVERL